MARGSLLLLTACAATDIVAIHRGACATDADACVDPSADDAAAKSCKPSVCAPVASQTALCQAASSLVRVGDRCEANSAVPSFRFALCSCTDLVSTSLLTTAAFQGVASRSVPNAASLGANRDVALSGSGTIDGEVRVGRRHDLNPRIEVSSVVAEDSPCSCGESQLLDVEGLVRARERDNDNAESSLSPSQLDGFAAAHELSLDCGRYYFTRIKGDHPLLITTRGHVAIFIGGNIELNDSLSVRTSEDGQVSVFVAGEVRVGGALALGGDPNGSSRVHLYLASRGTLALRGSTEIVGSVYAPRAELVTVGPYTQYGSLFVRRAAPGADMHLHYETSAASTSACEALP